MYSQTNEFVHLGGNVNHNADLSMEADRRIRKERCSFWTYNLELYERPSATPELKIRMLRAEALETMLYGGTRGGTFHDEMDRHRESQGWTTACNSMPERNGKDQGEDSPKQTC